MGSTSSPPVKRRRTAPWLPLPPEIELPPAATDVTEPLPTLDQLAAQRSLEKKQISFISATGKMYFFPFDECQTWQGMERCIRASYGAGPIDPCIEEGFYELYTSGNAGILPAHWEKMIEPGEVITMRMLQPSRSLPTPPPQAPPSQSPPPQVPPLQVPPQVPTSNRPARSLARPLASSAIRSRPPVEKKKVKFVSTAGKTYLLPFNICETWQGMEKCIQESCGAGPMDLHIQNGYYELVGPDDIIILLTVWEELVEPGWTVTMRMLPMPEPEEPQQLLLTAPEPKLENLPDNAHQVEVQFERRRDGREIYHFYYEDERREVPRSEWQQRTIHHGEQDLNCYLYTGKRSRVNFWTWTLDPEALETYIPKHPRSADDKRSKRKNRHPTSYHL